MSAIENIIDAVDVPIIETPTNELLSLTNNKNDHTNIPKYLLDQIEIIAKENGFIEYNLEQDAGSKHGDGFVASMLSIVITGTRQQQTANDNNPQLKSNERLALICKLAPDNQARFELINTEKIFERESYAYNVLLPTFIEFQKEKKIPHEKSFQQFPRCYYAVSDNGNKQHAIIMEDLRANGFALWDKMEPITFDHVKSLLTALGRFNGLSFALRDQRPEQFAQFHKLNCLITEICTIKPNIIQMMTGGFGKAIKMFESTDVGEILKSLETDWLKQYSKLSAPIEPFNVVGHGDCWNNNMMFNGQKEVSIIDWQTYRFCSPVIDVGYFLLSSTQKELRDQHIEEFLQIYYDSLAEMIQLCGSDPNKLYSFTDFQNQLKTHARLVLLLVPTMVAVMVSDPKNIVNMDDMAENLKSDPNATMDFLVGTNDEIDEKSRQRIFDIFTDAISYGWIESPSK